MIDSNLITLAKENKKTIESLRRAHDKLIDEIDAEERKKTDAIQDKIYALQDEKREIERKHEQERQELKSNKETAETELYEPQRKLNRIMEFMEVAQEKHDLDFSVYEWDYAKDKNGYSDYSKDKIKIPYKPFATIRENEYISLKAFIVKNRKPTNKFSLVVVGRSIFARRDNKIFDNPYSYGYWFNSERDNTKYGVKDAPTEEILKAYFEKSKEKILKDFLAQHEKAEEEYKEVLQVCNTAEWRRAYLEHKKWYYENCYSHGTETKEYKAIVRELKKFDIKKETDKQVTL